MNRLYVAEGPDKGQALELKGKVIYMGRSPDNDVRMTDRTVSRKHLKVVRRDKRYFVEDLKSKNGTYVNGEQIKPGIEVEVHEGHPIVIGMSVLCLGKGCLDLVKNYLDSFKAHEISRRYPGTETLVMKRDW